MKSERDLYIIGAGGFGREVAWLVERINSIEPTWNLKGFIDDNSLYHGTIENGYSVIGGCEYLHELNHDIWVVCAVGSANIRKAIVRKLEKIPHVNFATLIDPSVIISKYVSIGEGTIICAGTILTVNITMGKHVIVNLDCTLGHNDSIDNFVTIYPSVNVSGNVTIGECVELGTGTQIIQGKNIGMGSVIGAGAVVIRDIPEYCTAVGNPAKVIKIKSKEC